MPPASPLFSSRLTARRARGGLFRHGVLLLAALLVTLLVPTRAHAAVPMCSSDGRTVAAPPIILPWRQLTLEAAKPCQQPDNPLLRAMPEQQQKTPSSAPAFAPIRAMPARAFALAHPAGIRESIVAAESPPSFVLIASIYRPPRA
jgi:hypothetical protein